MNNYQEVLLFFAARIVTEPQTDYQLKDSNPSHFYYLIRDEQGQEYRLNVELERFGMKLRIPRSLFPESSFPDLLMDLEYQLEQSRGRNAKVSHQGEGEQWLVQVEI